MSVYLYIRSMFYSVKEVLNKTSFTKYNILELCTEEERVRVKRGLPYDRKPLSYDVTFYYF